jgi:hypothetical protein
MSQPQLIKKWVQRTRGNHWYRLGFLVVSFLGTKGTAQSPTSAQVAKNPNYIETRFLPAPVRRYLSTFGDRLKNPGNERTTLTGVLADSAGNHPVQITWEVPGRINVTYSDKSSPFIIDDSKGLVNGTSVQKSDSDVLESLFDDSSESFFYGTAQVGGYRLIGERFRADDGRTPNYAGPWYDIYEAAPSIRAHYPTLNRHKFFYFDSQTNRLAKVEYVLLGGVRVSSQYSNWTTQNGQSFPGKLVRKEDGVTVFTLTMSAAAFGKSASDGKFPGH